MEYVAIGALLVMLVFSFASGYCFAVRRIVRTAEENKGAALSLVYREFLTRRKHEVLFRQGKE